jgi:hypothetical protein
MWSPCGGRAGPGRSARGFRNDEGPAVLEWAFHPAARVAGQTARSAFAERFPEPGSADGDGAATPEPPADQAAAAPAGQRARHRSPSWRVRPGRMTHERQPPMSIAKTIAPKAEAIKGSIKKITGHWQPPP